MSVPQPAVQRELEILQQEMRACRLCEENGFPVQGPAVFSGPASAHMMWVGQAPARIDIDQGSLPWSGAGGRRLMSWMVCAGFDEETLRETQYLTALTRCFPGKHPSGKGDRPPGRMEQKLCIPYLAREIALIRPKVIVTVGGMAATRFLGKRSLIELVGAAHRPDARAVEGLGSDSLAGIWILPLPHPSGASLWLNKPAHLALVDDALDQLSRLRHEYPG